MKRENQRKKERQIDYHIKCQCTWKLAWDATHMIGERFSASPTASKDGVTDTHLHTLHSHVVGDAHHSKTDSLGPIVQLSNGCYSNACSELQQQLPNGCYSSNAQPYRHATSKLGPNCAATAARHAFLGLLCAPAPGERGRPFLTQVSSSPAASGFVLVRIGILTSTLCTTTFS